METVIARCKACNVKQKVSREHLLKKKRAPRCEVCGDAMSLPAEIRSLLGDAATPQRCMTCDSRLPAGSTFCAKCGTSQQGDARERLAAANFSFDQQLLNRLARMRFFAFLFRFFRILR